MKKSKFLLISTVIATIFSSTTVFANQGKIISGRTMIPLRGAFTDLGFEVSWDGKNNTATLKDENHVIKVKKDDVNFTVDGVSYKSDVAPKMINGSIYIPLKAIGEKIDADVFWDGDTEIASMFYDDDSTYIYLGTVDKLSKSSYKGEADTISEIINIEYSINDVFNEALSYADEGDFETATTYFTQVIDDCANLETDDFNKLSLSVQENIAYFAASTMFSSLSYIETMDYIDGENSDAAAESLDYANKYMLISNIYHDTLVDFFNATYTK